MRVQTPLFVAKKKGKPTKYYYTFDEYNLESDKLSSYDVTYIKGLGSLEKEDYKETVVTNPKMICVTLDDINRLNMVFCDKSADKRKEWMMGKHDE